MRLRSIWTSRGYSLRERFHRTGEWALIETAARMPRELQFRTFCAVINQYGWAHPQAEIPAITVDDVLKEWTR